MLSSGKVPFKIIYDGYIEKDKLIMLLEKYNYVYQQQYDYKNNFKYILVTECVWTSNENDKKENHRIIQLLKDKIEANQINIKTITNPKQKPPK